MHAVPSKHILRFSRNSEAKASEFLEKRVEIFPGYWYELVYNNC